MTERIHSLARRLGDALEDLETRFNEAYWASQIEATPENDKRRAHLELELRELLSDREALHEVEAALQNEIHDPSIVRELEILRLRLRANQMSAEERTQIVELSTAIESDFASFRPQVDGQGFTENEINEFLERSDDSTEREKVWRVSKEIGGEVVGRVRELVRVRNEAARNLGYADAYSMELELQELDEDWLFERMAELESLTDEPFRRWKGDLDRKLKLRFGTDELYPWHYADPFFQNLPPDGHTSLDEIFGDASAAALAQKTFAAWGLDLSDVLEKSDLYPRVRKCQHAFCINVDRRGDVRVLANVRPGEYWISVMLHECGHAAYDIAIDDKLPYVLRDVAHIFVTESIALLSGRLARDMEWLTSIAGVSPEDIEPLRTDLRRATAAQNVQFARWGLVMVHFERALYDDPEADLDALWWDTVERFQLLSRPPDAPRGGWASKIHIACAPVYYQNYLLGDMLASQLEATAQAECGGLAGSEAAGQMLRERIFKPGARLPWSALIEEATGRPLSAKDFAKDFAL
ncbi:MAG: M2 family metallopeptidase [Actinomycetota bacterium]